MNKKGEWTLTGCFVFVIVYTAIAYVNSLFLNYDLGFWTKYFTGNMKQMPQIYAFLICLLPLVGQSVLVITIVTFILSFCLGS